MYKQDWKLLNRLKIGIVGCGHLGQAIAQSLVDHGLEKENLIISYRGNPLTYQQLELKGLSLCIADNQRLFTEAGIILITVKPQDTIELKKALADNKSLIVSCMAGIPIKQLNKIFNVEIYRMMFSGPDTVSSGRGVATVYPQHEHLKLLISLLNLRYIQIGSEDDLDIFTAGVCMPAAILRVDNPIECAKAIEKIETEYPLLLEIYKWAIAVLPEFLNSTEKNQYINRMITKGGITEEIITSLNRGETLDASLMNGIARTKEISVEIQKSIRNS
ncbi:Pyrroline-5-carboxylate reductase [bioreactor metagenome]|uniref:Pyrroline-5-carboxylate reductase n=1 Tax=bioreactor metagenome TaxID=1076179 RepID=A0A645DSI8_9ZZZZ|nr:NAD(P)-binding domain-containing protein [Candidatus Metalachnospira sp.]